MTSDARLFREWHDWAFRRMSRTRFSIIKRARLREWPLFIRGTTFSLSVRKRLIDGVLMLFKRLISQRTRTLQSRLQRKVMRQVTNVIQCHLLFELGLPAR